ncbi:MAG TPA: hypothetical protein VLC07_01390, partial [Solirubrobacterales bacterium]|nr:hypothetical protein [Solirubrobacterales bacterium]
MDMGREVDKATICPDESSRGVRSVGASLALYSAAAEISRSTAARAEARSHQTQAELGPPFGPPQLDVEVVLQRR